MLCFAAAELQSFAGMAEGARQRHAPEPFDEQCSRLEAVIAKKPKKEKTCSECGPISDHSTVSSHKKSIENLVGFAKMKNWCVRTA